MVWTYVSFIHIILNTFSKEIRLYEFKVTSMIVFQCHIDIQTFKMKLRVKLYKRDSFTVIWYIIRCRLENLVICCNYALVNIVLVRCKYIWNWNCWRFKYFVGNIWNKSDNMLRRIVFTQLNLRSYYNGTRCNWDGWYYNT